MIKRRNSLHDALAEVEQGGLADVMTVVVSRSWWDSLSAQEQQSYSRRCAQRHIDLRVDDRLSTHFVEIIGGSGEPPLSSERRV